MTHGSFLAPSPSERNHRYVALADSIAHFKYPTAIHTVGRWRSTRTSKQRPMAMTAVMSHSNASFPRFTAARF